MANHVTSPRKMVLDREREREGGCDEVTKWVQEGADDGQFELDCRARNGNAIQARALGFLAAKE